MTKSKRKSSTFIPAQPGWSVCTVRYKYEDKPYLHRDPVIAWNIREIEYRDDDGPWIDEEIYPVLASGVHDESSRTWAYQRPSGDYEYRGSLVSSVQHQMVFNTLKDVEEQDEKKAMEAARMKDAAE